MEKRSTSKYTLMLFASTGILLIINWGLLFSGLLIPLDSIKNGAALVLLIPILFILLPILYYRLLSELFFKLYGRKLYQTYRDEIFNQVTKVITRKKKQLNTEKISLTLEDFEELLKKIPLILRKMIKKILTKIPFISKINDSLNEVEEAGSPEELIQKKLTILGDAVVLEKILDLPILRLSLVVAGNGLLLSVLIILF